MLSDVVIRWLEQVTSHYLTQKRVVGDVRNLLEIYDTLSPRTEVFTHDNGRSELLLNIHGTLPIQYKGAFYNIPISLWIGRDYPASPPWVYVVPTPNMLVRAGHGVDSSGLVSSPYILNWVKKPEAFNLIDLSYTLRNGFEMYPPLYAKPVGQIQPQQQQQQPQTSPPPRSTSQEVPSRPHKPPSISLSPTSTPSSSRNDPVAVSASQTSPQRFPPPGIRQFSSTSGSYDVPIAAPTHTYVPASLQPPAQPTTLPQPQPQQAKVTDLLTTEPDSIPYQHIPQSQSQPLASNNDSMTPPSKPTRPLNPNTVKLHATIHAIFSQKVSQSLENHKQLHDSQLTLKADLERAREVIVDESARLESVNEICRSVAVKVNETVNEGVVVLENGRRRGEIGVDEIVCADNLVSNQLLDLIAEDRAIDDTMYHLGRALNTGRVDLEKVLRVVRELSREQFFKRALCKKIQMGLEGSSDGNVFYGFVNSDQTESFHQ